jgi:hypothetical protein
LPRLPEQAEQGEAEPDRGQHGGQVQPQRQVMGTGGEHREDHGNSEQAEREDEHAGADEHGGSSGRH